MRLIAYAVFIAVYLPRSVVRRLRGDSPFCPRAHEAPSAWDQ